MNDDPSQWRAWSEKIERARAMKPRGTNMHLKPPPKPADARQAVTAPDNRQMVALKSDVKMELDYFLVHARRDGHRAQRVHHGCDGDTVRSVLQG